MSSKFSASMMVKITPEMKETLWIEASRFRKLPSEFVRRLLAQGLERSIEIPSPKRTEYEILLNDKDAKYLRRLGYELEQEAQEGPTPSLSGLLAPVRKS